MDEIIDNNKFISIVTSRIETDDVSKSIDAILKDLNEDYIIEIKDIYKNTKYEYRPNSIMNDLPAVKENDMFTKEGRILSYFTKIQEIGDDYLVVVRRPEVGLHYETQRRVAEILVQMASLFGCKIIIETYSPYIVRGIEIYAELMETSYSVYEMKNEIVDEIDPFEFVNYSISKMNKVRIGNKEVDLENEVEYYINLPYHLITEQKDEQIVKYYDEYKECKGIGKDEVEAKKNLDENFRELIENSIHDGKEIKIPE